MGIENNSEEENLAAIEAEHEATGEDVASVAEDKKEETSVLDVVDAALDDFNGTEKEAPTEEAATDVVADDAPKVGEDDVADNKPAEDSQDEDITIEPEGLSERASSRFKKLVEQRAEYEGKFQESNQRIEAIQQAMQTSSATADDMGQFLEVTRLSKSSSVDDQRAALAMLDKQRNALALMVGDAAPSTSALDAYPDLQDKVENMELETDTAMEIARGRHIQQQQQQQQQQAMQMQQQSSSVEQAQQQAIQQVVQLDQQWRQNDVDYAAKEKLIMPQMQRIRATLPPEQWAAATQLAYESVGQALSAQPKTRAPSPISNAGVSGAATGKPKSAMEAVEAALAGME